jgi:topoisomerase-4 subunit B
MATLHEYNEDSIKSLDWREHIRLRPGMYIGKLGDGTTPDDGIYILLKEVIDNCIDEFNMGNGKVIEIKNENGVMSVRDYGRGIPLGKVVDVVSKINTGAKYDSNVFQKSVGLNGVGTKAVNALSDYFRVYSVRDGKKKEAVFNKGTLNTDGAEASTTEQNGTYVQFQPDVSVFKNYKYHEEYIENMMWNYAFLNAGLCMIYNGKKFVSQKGLFDLLTKKSDPDDIRYPIIHLKTTDIEMALSHGTQYGEDYYTFVNGQHTTQGGTHQTALREALVKTVREFFKKSFEPQDVRASIICALSIRIQEPVFESQTKTRLGSLTISPDSESTSIRTFINDFVKKNLDDYLHKNPKVADEMLKRIMQSERERKEISGIKQLANQRAKKANLHNKNLRDCRIHFNDEKGDKRNNTMIFITEGDSASGSITKSRNVELQAVFSLGGKPLNSQGLTKKVVYENEEFNLLQHALNIEDGIDGLRYNKVIVATDADVDGMHIRLLLLTFFLQFFPELVRNNHVFILETPLFRVRNKKETIYCYSENEKQKAIAKLGNKPEITRFKGLGEISPEEFGTFINDDIKLEPVIMQDDMPVSKILNYYMGKNTPERQRFIIDNLRFEVDEALNEIEAEVALSEV